MKCDDESCLMHTPSQKIIGGAHTDTLPRCICIRTVHLRIHQEIYVRSHSVRILRKCVGDLDLEMNNRTNAYPYTACKFACLPFPSTPVVFPLPVRVVIIARKIRLIKFCSSSSSAPFPKLWSTMGERGGGLFAVSGYVVPRRSGTSLSHVRPGSLSVRRPGGFGIFLMRLRVCEARFSGLRSFCRWIWSLRAAPARRSSTCKKNS